ncbi:hypothetical protein RB595_010573 [Gaeumannomyces hyphopodioides]
MHCLCLLRALVLALPLAPGLAHAQPSSEHQPAPPPRRFPRRDVADDDVAAKRFVVEAAGGVSLDGLGRQLAAAGVRVVKTFDSDVFSGLTVETGSHTVEGLRRLGAGSVARAWPVQKIPLPPTVAEDEGASLLSSLGGEGAAAQNWSIHHSTGVDKLHAAGVLGKGVKVAVIDSGVDYRHPALGGGFGPGFKVSGGYDLVGDEYDGTNPKKPDGDPMDFLGHGTHVSGIIAGKNDFFAGVAPEAEILSFKVFGALEATDEDTLVEATLMAYEAGADIITASIGRASGFADGAWATVASRIVGRGVVVTIAAGNDGEEGPMYASSGSSGRDVLAVAAVDTSLVPAKPWRATFSSAAAAGNQTHTAQMAYIPPVNRPPWNLTGLPIRPLSLDTANPADGCSPLADDTPDLSGVIVLVRRSLACSYYDVQANVEKFGARAVLFYNNDRRPFAHVVNSAYKSQLAMIDAQAGAAIVGAVRAGGSVTADFTAPRDDNWAAVGFRDSPVGGIPSSYSSWGGTNDLGIKPDVAAPGSRIWSTFLNGTFKTLSGTSMATPYLAGVAALYIGARGGRQVHGPGFARALSRRLVASGESLPWQVMEVVELPVDFGFLSPVPQAGSGLVNASRVLAQTTALAFEPLALNDTANFRPAHAVDITNGGGEPVSYTFSLLPAGGFNLQGRTTGFLADVLDVKPFSLAPRVDFSAVPFVVAPGQTRRAELAFTAPQVADQSKLPVYSGKVVITGSNGDVLGVPYYGAAFDLRQQTQGRMFPPSYPFQRSGPRGQDIDVYNKYSFNLSRAAQDFPKVHAMFFWGVKELRWDIFDPSYNESQWTYPPVAGRNGYVGSATYSTYASSQTTFDPATMDKDRVLPFPVTLLERTTSWSQVGKRFWWLGRLANGSDVAPGRYRMRFAALAPSADPARPESWTVWKTPEISVV